MINSCIIRPAFVALAFFTILSVSSASVAPLWEAADKSAVSLPLQTDLVSAAITHEKSNQELEAFLQDFSTRCSVISKLTTFGKSGNGFPLYALEISDKPGQVEPEPNLKIIANIHGDETLGRALVVGLAEWLCQNYKTNAVAKRIVNGVHLFLVPTLNPDGFDAVTRANAKGVDLNRNFPDRFDDPTCAPTGKEQPEVKAMMAWSEAIKFAASISFHGGALVVNYPWDGTKNGSYYNNPSPDDATFRYISLAYANAHGKMTDSNNAEFPTGMTNGAQWYTIYGGMQDWNYVRTGCMEVTIETGEQKLPADIELPGEFNKNLPAMLEFIQKAGLAGLKGKIFVESGRKAKVPVPAEAKIVVKGINKVTVSGNKLGYYYRPLAPGKYTIEVSKTGYKTATATVTIPTNGKGAVLDFVLKKAR